MDDWREFEQELKERYSYLEGMEYLENEFNLSLDPPMVDELGDEYLYDNDQEVMALMVNESDRKKAFDEGAGLEVKEDYRRRAERLVAKHRIERYLISCIQGVIVNITRENHDHNDFNDFPEKPTWEIDFLETLLAYAELEIDQPSQKKELSKIKAAFPQIKKKFLQVYLGTLIKRWTENLDPQSYCDLKTFSDFILELKLMKGFLKNLAELGGETQFFRAEIMILIAQANRRGVGELISGLDNHDPHLAVSALIGHELIAAKAKEEARERKEKGIEAEKESWPELKAALAELARKRREAN